MTLPLASPDPVGFIRDHTRILRPPHVPEVQLHLADEAVPLWQATEEELEQSGLPPPFWAFAWAGGQALARYVLDHPQLVAGRTVLDLASGSGLVGIAAVLAGAGPVRAADIDPFALHAMVLNATLNGVELSPCHDDLIGSDVPEAVILVGDLFYERDLAERLTNWLVGLNCAGREVLVGDPGRTYLPRQLLEEVACYEVAVSRDLEDAEIKRTRVWRFRVQ